MSAERTTPAVQRRKNQPKRTLVSPNFRRRRSYVGSRARDGCPFFAQGARRAAIAGARRSQRRILCVQPKFFLGVFVVPRATFSCEASLARASPPRDACGLPFDAGRRVRAAACLPPVCAGVEPFVRGGDHSLRLRASAFVRGGDHSLRLRATARITVRRRTSGLSVERGGPVDAMAGKRSAPRRSLGLELLPLPAREKVVLFLRAGRRRCRIEEER